MCINPLFFYYKCVLTPYILQMCINPLYLYLKCALTQIAELDGNKHSGGERAVATVMFLMALQEMTSAPFRCPLNPPYKHY
jgi:hypothetical protein